MPQLDPNSFPSQLFWLVISFWLLYVVVARYALPKVAEVLQARQERISNDLDKAATIKEEAEELEQEYEALLEKNRSSANSILTKAGVEIKELTDARHAELGRVLEQKQLHAQAALDEAKAEAMAKIAAISSELAVEVAKNVAGVKVSGKKADNVVDDLVKKSA